MSDIERLEKRLHNTEVALYALWVLLEDLQPPEYANDIGEMMSQYSDANKSLGVESMEPWFFFD